MQGKQALCTLRARTNSMPKIPHKLKAFCRCTEIHWRTLLPTLRSLFSRTTQQMNMMFEIYNVSNTSEVEILWHIVYHNQTLSHNA